MQVAEQCLCHSFEAHKAKEEEISADLKVLVNKIARKEGLTTYDLKAKKIIADGTNFLGVLTEVTIHDIITKKNIDLFIKSILPNADEVKIVSVLDAYDTEIYFYLELSKLLEKLQDDAHVPPEERYKFVKTYKESNTQHIIMENMIKKNYNTWNRFDIISLEFGEKAIKLLAKFHALGFVLQEKEPEYYERKLKPLKYGIELNEEFHQYFVSTADNAMQNYLEGSAKYKLQKALKELYEKGKEYVSDQDTALTMIHGDYRPNNILIQQIEGEITDMIPVDYQFLYHGTPLLDLIYFIFSSTDREFRRKHLDHLKYLYHDTMKEFLKYFGMDVQKHFPKEEYERLFKERLDLGLFYGIWYLQANLAEGEDILDLSKTQITEMSYGKNELAKIRIRDLVDDFIEWGYL